MAEHSTSVSPFGALSFAVRSNRRLSLPETFYPGEQAKTVVPLRASEVEVTVLFTTGKTQRRGTGELGVPCGITLLGG